MFIVRYKNLFIALALIFIISAVAIVATKGLKYGIDFPGGTLAQVDYPQGKRPDTDALKSQIDTLKLGDVTVQASGENGIIIRSRTVNDQERIALLKVLTGDTSASSTVDISTAASTTASTTEKATVKQFDSIGPVIGSELKNKSMWAIVLVILLIVAYITFAFRHVSRPVSSWKYGVIAIASLVHDVIVPTGFYAAMGGEVGVLFVTAILAILGFSVHDTIVVFDRIRENLKSAPRNEAFLDTVGKSLNQTFTRSINTSLTVVLVLVALFFSGGASTQDFALVLIVGIIAGTFSSIFFAAPLLVQVEKWQKKIK
jgi:preprotein translocase subunit SecF